MIIAVTSSGDQLQSAVDPRFGRAAKFVIFNTENGEWSVADNVQNLQAAQGAGIQAAQQVLAHNIQALLTGHCGPKAFRVLNTAGVRVYTGLEDITVEAAVAKFNENELVPAQAADVEGHW